MSESAEPTTEGAARPAESASATTEATSPVPETLEAETESAGPMTETAGATAGNACLRILHLVAEEEMPGEAERVLSLVERLAKLGHTQSLMAAADSAIEAEARSRGLEVAPLSLPSIAQMSRGFDLVHAHDSRAHSMAAATARAPVVASRRIAKPVLRSPAARWKYRRTAHFIAASHEVETLLLNAGIAPERVSVVCDSVDPARAAEETLGVYRRVLEPPQPESSSS